MISKKILYSEQILQLVLALSLLQVDPINYLEWGVSRIHYDDGSPWQLEIAQTPFSDYPYMNRKTYAPLIEDLIDVDSRIRGHDVQAYLLNLSDNNYPLLDITNDNSEIHNNNNNTTTSNASSIESINTRSNSNSEGATTTEPTLNLINLVQDRFHEHQDDIFLQSEISTLENPESIIDQNLADLNDYEDRQLPTLLNVPIKQDDFVENGFQIGQNNSQSIGNRVNVLELNLNRTDYSSSDVIDWSEYISLFNDSSTEDGLRKSEDELTNSTNNISSNSNKTDDSNDIKYESDGITSSVELTLEVIMM